MKFSVFQVSRKGGRVKNEDRMGYCYTAESSLFFLADGMGGHPEGEIASQLTLQVIAALFQQEARPALPDVREFFNRAVIAAHREILRYAAERGLTDTPRTTLVAVVLQGGAAHWVHCGDSRLYFVRREALLARTRDHSYAEQRRRERPGSEERAPDRNVLYTCLGSPTRPFFDLSGPVPLQQGDRLLLCSDGLWAPLQEEDIVRQLAQSPVSASAPALVEEALRRGGPRSDNVTVVALEWETPDSFAPTQGALPARAAGVLASTVQAAWADSKLDDLDEAAIERSISEINETIGSASVRKG